MGCLESALLGLLLLSFLLPDSDDAAASGATGSCDETELLRRRALLTVESERAPHDSSTSEEGRDKGSIKPPGLGGACCWLW